VLAQDAPAKSLGVVTVTGGQPTSLPTQIPTTMEGIDREQIERSINATDSEDALKYLPSLLVRKRYIGDYNHAILSSRASGTGNSARSLVYADGILLSNLLGNGVGGLSTSRRAGAWSRPRRSSASTSCTARSPRPTRATRWARWSTT
jgi:iron complex outermembrane receptor protein